MIFINPYRFGDVNDNIFLALVNNQWSNPANWTKGVVPTSTQNAIIRANCSLNVTATVAKLIVDSGYTLTGDSSPRVLTVNGECKIDGAINLAAGGHNIILLGTTNSIVGFTPGVNSIVTYGAAVNQSVLNLNYNALHISGVGIKSISSNLTVNSLSFQGGTLQLGAYNLSVSGATLINAGGKLLKSGAGSVLFGGLLTINGGVSEVNFSAGNPNIEFRNGINGDNGLFYAGTSTVKFTTNNQTLIHYYRSWTISNVEIVGSIVLTIQSTLNIPGYLAVDTINGTTSGSTLRIGANGDLRLLNNSSPMVTGIFQYNYTATSMVTYSFNGNYVLPYGDYSRLQVLGTGTKSANQNMIINSLALQSGGALELGAYDLTVNGQTNLVSGLLSKNGAGNIVFKGLLYVGNVLSTLSFTGNPNVEFQNGIGGDNGILISGTGDWKFTTNNQSLQMYAKIWVVDANVIIDNGIEVTFFANTLPDSLTINGTLNGNNSASKWINGSLANLYSWNSQAPMLTGQFLANNAANSVNYTKAGNQDVQAGTYRTLQFGGSGVKKLLGNVVVNTTAGGSWSITGTATIDYNGFTITTI